ncbi:hypothetical protein M9H77_24237 [Catharanthus roseus]|uniref:Uncharacterized protein n=1 Tax=Catharanthus roseus TaxID=4058 RepID=A0ACC0AVJ3_CATRO|nr:hypothetical protein M9H77_24237 [Catharanthus roseus]
MECNKDEAIRAKKLAEKKLTEKDIAGAKRFASKAQNLFPALEGLSQLQETLDVYVASQKTVNGEVDWYEIFGVDPLADDETIRKKYRKLALALHPDKNKSVGADGAFKIISEAWSLLSDKGKRDAYNEKRNIRASYQKARGGNPPAGAGKSFHKNSSSSSSKPSNPTTKDKSQPDIKASSKKPNSRNPPATARKSSNTNFKSNSSSREKPQKDSRPSNKKVRGENPSTGTVKSNCNNFTASSSNTINPATPDNPQKDTRTSYQKARDGNPPAPAGKSKNTAAPEYSHSVPVPSSANRNTFWTSCLTCMMQYEYVRIYRNQRLLCPNCRKPFLASEMPPPTMGHKSSTKGPFRRKQQAADNNVFSTSTDSGRKNMKTYGNSGVPPASSSKCSGAGIESISVMAAGQPAQSFQSADESLKRGIQDGVTGAVSEDTFRNTSTVSGRSDADRGSNFGKGEPAAKKRRVNEYNSHVRGKGLANQMDLAGGDNVCGDISGSPLGGLGIEKVNISGSNEPKCFRDFSQSEIPTMLMEKAKMEILKKVSELGMAAATKFAGEACKDVEKEMPHIIETEESVTSGMKKEENMNAAVKYANHAEQEKDSLPYSVTTDSDSTATNIWTMTTPVVANELKESSLSETMEDGDLAKNLIVNVPDSDFMDFDKGRGKESFAENQVWAAYDNEDGMPRFYAFVHGVTSGHPSEVKISWLNSRSNSAVGTLNCVGCGFHKTCGDFRISRREVGEALNSFSHRVMYTSVRGVIKVFPRKGNVWALYRNWSCDWNELTPDDVIRKYDVVEVLEDYNEEHGVLVAPLVKVAGFKSVFHRHLDPRKFYTIPREEMSRFSHQVPSCLLTCHGDKKAPKGCLELDPAAVPEELLRVIEEPEEEEADSMLKFGEDARGDVGEDEGTTSKCMEWVIQM